MIFRRIEGSLMLQWGGRGAARSTAAGTPPPPDGDLLARLCAVVPFIPIPPARPAYERFDEAAGLTLLELSLRMDHVHRVTEALTFVDSTHMRRAVSVDVDLRQLTARQRGAVQARPVGPTPPNGGGPTHLWVPIARQSRGDLASVEIRDQAGVLVPRLTSDAIRRALVAGLASFVKTQIMASGQLQGDRFLQARWLIERAVAHYVEHGSHGMWDRLLDYELDPSREDGEVRLATTSRVEIEGPEGPLSAEEIRRTALAWLRGGNGAAGEVGAPLAVRQQFAQLLDIAANQQLLVVLLPVVAGDEHLHLHFEAPPVPVRHGPEEFGSYLRGLFELGREYRVEYETQVPRHASSYHVTVEVPEEIKVRRFLLSSDANDDAVRRLADDLRQLAGEAQRLVPGAAPQPGGEADGRAARPDGVSASDAAAATAVSEVRRAELVDALARVASVSRFRNAELVAYRSYMTQTFEGLGGGFPDRGLAAWQARAGTREALGRARLREEGSDRPGPEQARCRGDVEEVILGRTSLAVLGALAAHHERGTLVGVLVGMPADRLRDVLQNLAVYLVDSELGTDVVTDNDPRENGAHAHWSRPELRFGPRVNEPVHIRFTVSLADEPPALAETVALMVVCLLIVVGVMWLFVTPTAPQAGQPKGLSQADAIVAVLLLVPSILLARLDVASKRTVLGELRQTPRRLAYIGVLATGVLALITAGDAQHFTEAAGGVLGVLGLLLLTAVGELVTRAFRRRNLVPASSVTPHWLMEAVLGRRPKGVPDAPDARFDAIGQMDGDDDEPGGFWRRVTAGILWVQQRGHPAAEVVRKAWRWVWRLKPARPWRRRSLPGLRSVEAVSRAARTAADRRTAVEFVVAHLADTLSAHDPSAGHHDRDECAGMSEMLAVTTLGMTVEIRTRAVSEPEHKQATARPGESRVMDLVPVPRPDHGHTVVRGHLRVGPPGAGPGRERNELLLQAGPPNALSPQQARMLLHVVHELAWLMVLHRAMPVHITFPAAEPADGSSAAEQLRNAAAPYIRLAVSNAGQFAHSRMAFEERVIELAQRLGLGVWLSQGRASSDVAQWRRVVTFVEKVFTDVRQELFPWTSTDNDISGGTVQLATFVLPAGDDVTRALAELACRVHQDGLGIHSLSSWPLQQSVFVTVAFRSRPMAPLARRPSAAVAADAVTSPWFGAARPWAPTDPDGWQHGYRRLVRRAELDPGGPCGCLTAGSVAQQVLERDRRTQSDAASIASRLAREPADSGRVPRRRPAAADLVALSESSMRRRPQVGDIRVVPFWVAWEVPERTDVDLLTASLVGAFRRHNTGRDAWVTFLRARHDDRDHMRGRAKVAVPVPTIWTPSALGLLAQKVQEDVRRTLDGAFPHRGSALSFQVAWGERWLDGSR